MVISKVFTSIQNVWGTWPLLWHNKHPSSLVFASLQGWMSHISESAKMSGSVGNFSSPPPGFGPNRAEETPTPKLPSGECTN